MYGLTGVILYFLYGLKIYLIFKILMILLSTTIIEFITGYFYFKIKKVKLWDYSNNFLNYKGLICPEFSFYWLGLSLLYYFFIIPFLI